MNKKLPVALSLIHALVSAISSYKAWPLKVIAGLEAESIAIAVVAAAIGTILGLIKVTNKRLIPVLVVLGLLFVLAVSTYSYILSGAGATPAQLIFALVLLFVIFLIFFYILTHLEKALARAFPARNETTS